VGGRATALAAVLGLLGGAAAWSLLRVIKLSASR
jgi:hypothetical protein